MAALGIALLAVPIPPASAAETPARLDDEIGRSETRIYGAPYRIETGLSVADAALPDRLERLGYRRVHRLPEHAGEYFWGHDVVWIYRRSHRWGGRQHPASLFGLALDPAGRVRAALTQSRTEMPIDPGSLWLEPPLLSESIDGDRAIRRPVRLEDLPDRVWRAVLAAEDHRFFEHRGVSARAVARALLENLSHGGVVQGGSTITQQLVKNRDLTPRRTLGRKISEGVRALALEAEYDKEEILESYLNHVYLGHRDGLAIHGVGAAARVYFSKPAAQLTLAEAAMLAGMIRSPNRLAPDRHPSEAEARRNGVLSRMEELGWASADAVLEARATPPRLQPSPPSSPPAPHFLRWVGESARSEAGRRLSRGRGVVVETTLDLRLQEQAEAAVRRGLDAARRSSGARDVSAALVALDAGTGDVLAYVGGDPDASPPGFDHVRQARRQPGSVVKPLLLLEAFDDCGPRAPLYPATRIADAPLSIERPGGPWRPGNADGSFAGTITLRRALVESRNVPFVRLARWCGWDETAAYLDGLGLPMPEDPPPAFALGAVEATPLDVARAYSALAGGGESVALRPWSRIEEPDGDAIEARDPRRRRVAGPGAAYLVADLMEQAAREGTARPAAVPGRSVAAKTGTSSERRDAWLAGFAEGIVVVVWVGRDDGSPLGITGSRAAAPIFQELMTHALPARGRGPAARPEEVVPRWVDSRSGLLVRSRNPRAVEELFLESALPPRDRWWRSDEPVRVVE